MRSGRTSGFRADAHPQLPSSPWWSRTPTRAGRRCWAREGHGLADGICDPAQVRRDVLGYLDAEFIRVGEANILLLRLQFFDDQEQGVHLSSGVVFRGQGLAHVLNEGFVTDITPRPLFFCDAQVLLECVSSIGHPSTLRAATVVSTKMRPTR